MRVMISLSSSPALISHPHPHLYNYRGTAVLSSSSSIIKSDQLWPSRPRSSITSTTRIPNFIRRGRDRRGMSIESGNNVESAAAVPTSVPVRVAYELLQAGHRYLDVRTSEEFSDGHVVGAVNVPFMLRVGPGMTTNPKFLEEVLSHFGKDDEIIVGCQLGKRSLVAASELLSSGFTGITDMAGGYAAWVENGLPTTK